MRRKGETAAGTQWLGIFANPDMPYKPSDFNAMTVGQLKYIASLIYSPLAGAGYTGLTPSWIVQNTNTDNVAANVGQLKQVFAWDIASAPATVSGVVATASNPGEIDLSWTNPLMNNATSFVIQQSTDGGATWTTVDTLTGPTLNSYAVTGLSQGTGYQFQVLASNPLGGSSPASTPTPTNMAPVAPRYAVIDLGTNFFPVAINASGIVVGNDTNGFAAVWDQGTQTALAASSIGNGHATAINASGMIAGYGGFTYSQTNDDGSVDSAVETHACSWSPPYTSVTDLDTQQGDPDSDHNHWEFVEHDGWVSQALAISDNGSIYGFQNFQSADQPVSFSSNAAPVASNVRTSWDPFGGAQDVGSGLGGRIIGAAGTNWCGYYNISESNPIWTNGCIVNNQIIPVPSAYSNNSDFRATAINTNGVAVGYVVTNYPSSQPLFIQGGAITNLPGAGRASAINDLFTTNITSGGTVTNVVATPQIVGVDNSTNGTLWDQTMYDGTPTTNTYLAKNLNLLIPGASGTGTNVPPWHVTSISGINNGGTIVGTATYSGTNTAIATGSHGVMLLPCQFALLNGSTNTADRDGMFFDGTRPTTVSALQNYTSSSFIEETTNSQDGYDILGPLPFGNGVTGEEGDVCVDSLIVAAKVMPSTANVTYGWSRFVQDADVAITYTSTNTWYVNSIPGHSLPPPTNNDTGSSSFYTVAPSTNGNVIAYSDGPGMNIQIWTDQCGLGDYAYHKDHFTYFLTNSVGSTNAVATLPIGQVMVCRRIHTNHTTPPVAGDWTNVINIISTANIPDCNGYTTNEIRQIVGPGNPIIFDSSVPVNQ